MLQRGRKSIASLAVFTGAATPRQPIRAPANLTSSERQTFEQLIADSGSDYFVKTDALLLAGYVRALGLMDLYAEKARSNPAYAKAHHQACRSAGLLAQKLRLAPFSRMSARVASRVAKERQRLSAYDLMELKNDADDDN